MRWKPSANRKREQAVADGLRRASKFYVFLWSIREELFDDAFQDELISAYDPRGQEPCPPAMLAMVMLLQRYQVPSDAAAVDEAENDQRRQLVLGTLGKKRAPFGQGTLVRFREKLIAHNLDKRLVDRTVELAKKTKRFGWKQLRVAFDSSPLEGAGRVEDTWNLIGRAMAKLVGAVSKTTGVTEDKVIRGARLTLMSASSVKAALDIDWSDPDERHEALQRLISEAEQLEAWVLNRLEDDARQPPVSDALALLRRVASQDLEPDPNGGGRRIRDGVAHDRIISVGDPEMRHGRKSSSKTKKATSGTSPSRTGSSWGQRSSQRTELKTLQPGAYSRLHASTGTFGVLISTGDTFARPRSLRSGERASSSIRARIGPPRTASSAKRNSLCASKMAR